MQKVVIADPRKEFLADVTTRVILEDRNVEILGTTTSIEQLNAYIADRNPEAVIVHASILEEQENWEYAGCVVVGYASNKNELSQVENKGLPSYGVVKNAKTLLDKIEGPIPPIPSPQVSITDINGEAEQEIDVSQLRNQQTSIPTTDEPVVDSAPGHTVQAQPVQMAPETQYNKQLISSPPPVQSNNPYSQSQPQPNYPQNGQPVYPPYQMNGQAPYQPGSVPYPPQPVFNPQTQRWEYPPYFYQNAPSISNPQTETANTRAQNQWGDTHNTTPSYAPNAAPSETNAPQKPLKTEAYYGQNTAEQRFNRDFHPPKPKTVVAAVYAAKGGVGKTTIATQTAVCLALTSAGRNKYRVCIVDYNIDFGDVRMTLGFSDSGVDMYPWVLDIKDRIKNGEKPEDIQYSRKEIESYLQVLNKIGLYGLCAPKTHQESMGVESDELEIMLRNIIQNGEFDFVICDTGNNTRDSSIIALQMADYVLLVATQDVTTAACNSSVIEALDRFGFDLGKVRLIINNIMSVKYTGLYAEEVERYFSKYPCIAHIQHSLDVVKSNNLNEPIVLKPNHPVTKEFRKIVRFLTGEEEKEESQPEKKKRFGLFNRRR